MNLLNSAETAKATRDIFVQSYQDRLLNIICNSALVIHDVVQHSIHSREQFKICINVPRPFTTRAEISVTLPTRVAARLSDAEVFALRDRILEIEASIEERLKITPRPYSDFEEDEPWPTTKTTTKKPTDW